MGTYRTMVLILILSLIFLSVPLALIILKHTAITSTHIEWIEWLAVALALALVVITGWRLKRGLKVRMKRGLGREVKDSDLTSIAAWMEIPDQAARAAKEAEKYDFNN